MTPPSSAKERFSAAWTSWPGSVLRLALVALPFAWLSRSVVWGDVPDNAVAIGPVGLALSEACVFGAVVVSAIRWRVLLIAYGADRARLPSTLTLLRYYLIACYFAVLPSGMVGEAVRGHRLEGCFEQRSTAYLLLVVERLAGLLGLLLVATPVLVGSPLPTSALLAHTFDVALIIAFVLSVALFAVPQVARWSPGLRARVAVVPVVGPIVASLPAANDVWGPLVAVLLSVLTQVLTAMSALPLLRPIAPDVTLSDVMLAMPAVLVVTFIQITPGALGQREVAFVESFRLVGVAAEDALAASLATTGLAIALALVGGVVLLVEKATAERPA